MKKILFLFFMQWSFLIASPYSIVFVHIGESLPPYIETSVTQARLFNPDAHIFLVVNQAALKDYPSSFFSLNIDLVTCETLPVTQEHKDFLRNSTHDVKYREGFWQVTSERFLYLYDLMAYHKLDDVFHLENDVMLYTNLADSLIHFKNRYKGIGATFDNDERCIPGFLYFATLTAMKNLALTFANLAHLGLNDMQLLGRFKRLHGPDKIDTLPIIMSQYVSSLPLKSAKGQTTTNPGAYCKNFDAFQSIFDAAAYGQYLGGQDPRNGPSKAGFVNESSLVNPANLQFLWLKDSKQRKVPYAVFKGTKCPINCLHIHSKKLEVFAS